MMLLTLISCIISFLSIKSLSLALKQQTKCHHNYDKSGITAYWINLEKNIGRRRFMEHQLQQIGLRHERISAITPDSVEFNVTKLEKPCKRNTEKDIAVILSHLKAIHSAILDETEDLNFPSNSDVKSSLNKTLMSNYALILEDDVRILFNIDFEKLIKSVPNQDFGILQLVTSNVEALTALWEDFSSSTSSSTSSRFWKESKWTDKTKNGKTGLYWSAQAYLINKKVIKHFINDVIESFHIPIEKNELNIISPSSRIYGKYSRFYKVQRGFKIINSFHPSYCKRTKTFPCVLSNCLFSDSYIYAGGGPTFVSTIPLFNGAKIGLNSTIHQAQVYTHQEAFSLIRKYYMEIRREYSKNERDLQLPSFISPLLNCSSR